MGWRSMRAGGSIVVIALAAACGAEQANTAQAPVAPSTTPALSCDLPGLGGYDLLDFSVEQASDTVVFTATFQPIEPRHDVVVAFTSPDSSQRIAGELFEDGSGVAQLQDVATLDTVYLDGPQEFAADHMRISVPREQLDSDVDSGPITVDLDVDGQSVESCAATRR